MRLERDSVPGRQDEINCSVEESHPFRLDSGPCDVGNDLCSSEGDELEPSTSTDIAGSRPRTKPVYARVVVRADSALDQILEREPALSQWETVDSQPMRNNAEDGITPPIIEQAARPAEQGEPGTRHAGRADGGSRWSTKDIEFLWEVRVACEADCACTWERFYSTHWLPAHASILKLVDAVRTVKAFREQYRKLKGKNF